MIHWHYNLIKVKNNLKVIRKTMFVLYSQEEMGVAEYVCCLLYSASHVTFLMFQYQ